MIKKNGFIYRLDTQNTSLILDAERGEYLYYGNKPAAAGDFTALRGRPRRFVSCMGKDADFSEQSVNVVNADGGMIADFQFSKARILTKNRNRPGYPRHMVRERHSNSNISIRPSSHCMLILPYLKRGTSLLFRVSS